jgi:hypothetical protein
MIIEKPTEKNSFLKNSHLPHKSSSFQSLTKGIKIRQNSAKNRFNYLRVDLLNIVIIISDLQTIENPFISKLQCFLTNKSFRSAEASK